MNRPSDEVRILPFEFDRDGDVGELQTLDIADPVGAVVAAEQPLRVAADDGRARPGVIDGDEALRVEAEQVDVVVGEHVVEHRGVDIRRIDVAAQQGRYVVAVGIDRAEVERAIRQSGEFGGVAVRIVGDLADDLRASRVAGQPDMQEGIAVDHIAAAAAGHHVAARAAQHDVAGVVGDQARREEAREADDQIGVVELVLGGEQPCGVGALQDVVERRAADALGELVDVADAVFRAVRGHQFFAVQVGIHAVDGHFIRRPVIA